MAKYILTELVLKVSGEIWTKRFDLYTMRWPNPLSHNHPLLFVSSKTPLYLVWTVFQHHWSITCNITRSRLAPTKYSLVICYYVKLVLVSITLVVGWYDIHTKQLKTCSKGKRIFLFPKAKTVSVSWFFNNCYVGCPMCICLCACTFQSMLRISLPPSLPPSDKRIFLYLRR